MGGVQFSTYFLAEYLMKEESAEAWIFLPGEGKFSVLCQENSIPYSIYNSIPYISTSISLFNDKIRIPNLLAWVYNICVVLLNCMRITKKLKKHICSFNNTDLVIKLKRNQKIIRNKFCVFKNSEKINNLYNNL